MQHVLEPIKQAASRIPEWAIPFLQGETAFNDIAGKIVATIAGGYEGVLEKAWREGSARMPPSDLQAYDLLLRSNAWIFGLPGYKESKSQLERAIALDPNYARVRA